MTDSDSENKRRPLCMTPQNILVECVADMQTISVKHSNLLSIRHNNKAWLNNFAQYKGITITRLWFTKMTSWLQSEVATYVIYALYAHGIWAT